MKNNRYDQNNKIDGVRFSTQIFMVGAILSATFFLLFIDVFKTYRSEISIVVIAKSQLAVAQQPQISANIAELSKTLSFYDIFLKHNPDVRDAWSGQSPDQRKAGWNRTLSVEQKEGNDAAITISLTAKNQNDAKQLSQKTARTLFDVASSYYDVKKDIDLRIIDGPIIKSQLPAWQGLAVLSIVLGYAIAVLLQAFVSGSRKMVSKRSMGVFLKNKSFFDFKKNPKMPIEDELELLNNLYRNEKAQEDFVFEQKAETSDLSVENHVETNQDDYRIEEMKKLTKQMEPEKYPNFPEMPIRSEMKAGAPDNLPIADNSSFEGFGESEEIASSVSAEIEAPVVPAEKKEEPTPEELKERLNKLLRGDF